MKRYDDPSALNHPAAAPARARTGQGSPLRPARSMLALETRIVFDGAIAATALADPHDAAASGLHQPAIAGTAVDAGRTAADAARAAALAPERAPAEAPTRPAGAGTIVFIDASVANPQTLLAGLKPGVEVVMLDKNRDGVQQIADALKGRHDLDSIQIISEGSTGRIILGSSVLSDHNIDSYQSALANWGAALRSGGDILLYGCNVADNQTGEHFVNRLAQLTGADIAASTDATGAAALGGNWVLEKHTGSIEAEKAISERALADYAGLLLTGNGTADGTYDFGGTYGSASGGFRPLADKLKVSDMLAQDGTVLFANSAAAATDGGAITAVFKAEGGSVAKTFTFVDFNFSVTSRGAGLNTRTVDQLVVVLTDTAGNIITTLQMAGSTLTLSTAGNSLSSLINGGVAFSYADVASVSITISLWKTTDHGGDGGAASEINFASMTMSNISAGPVNTAPVFVGAATTLSIPQNGGTFDVRSLLHASDSDSGQTLSWTTSTAPLHGTLSISGATGASGNTDITPGGTITYTPAAGYAGTDTFTVQVSDGTSTVTRTITVIVTPATPGTPDLAAGSDTGNSNTDKVTNAASLTFSGASAAGDNASTVRVFLDVNGNGVYDAGTDASATATVNNGAWTVTGLSTAGVGDGSYSVYAITTATTGSLSSTRSAGLAVTIDKTLPGSPSNPIIMSAASDSGSSNSDGRTNVTNPLLRISLAGTNAVSGDTLELLLGGNSFGTPMRATLNSTNIANGYIDMAIVSGSLGADGTKVLASRVTDIAGNVGTAGGSFTITLDTTRPGTPSNPILMAAASDSGSSNSDGRTNVTNPLMRISLAGTTAVIGDTLELLLGGNSFGTPMLATLNATNIANGYIDMTIVSGSLGADGTKVLTSRVTDMAGNAGTAGGSFTITLDTTRPGTPSNPIVLAAASDSGASNSDGITNVTNPTVRVSLAGTNAAVGDTAELLLAGATFGTPVRATLTSTDISAGYIDLTVSSGGLGANGSKVLTGRVTDVAGNAGTAGSALTITLDTTVAPPSMPALSSASDSGSSNSDRITNVTTPIITGTAESGSTVTLYDTNGTTVLGTTIVTGGTWSITSSALGNGAHSLTARAVDAAGNTSAASGALSVTIDATMPATPAVPVLDPASDSGVSNSDRITRVTTPVINGTAESGSTVTLYDSDGSTVLGTTVATGGVWSITSSALADGVHNLSVKATDTAGNTSAASGVLAVTIATVGVAPGALTLDAASDSGSSNADRITNVTTPTINGTALSGSIVTLYDSDGITVLGTTVAAGGVWSITSSALGQGVHTLTAKAFDAVGNTSPASTALSITIDTSIPAAPSAPSLDSVSDSGGSNSDQITKFTNLLITGTAESGSTVTLYGTDGVTVLGSTIASGGAWSISTSTLADGMHILRAKASDAAGNVSAASDPLSITVDTSVAAPGTPSLASGSDTGASNSDGITSVTNPLISGTAEAGSSVTLYDSDGVTVLGTTIATGGVWSITSSTLGDGSHTLKVTATDTAGNTSAVSSLLSITIDSSAPAAPPAPVLSAASDSGVSNSDGVTNISRPTITGRAENGSRVTLYDSDGVTVLGTTVATGGVWSITSSTLGDGTHTLTAKATDTAGNSSAASSLLSITIDSSAPAAPPAPVLSAASDSGAADGITRVTTPVITGTAESGSSVTLYDSDGVTVLGTTIATGGVWSITSSTLGDGSHTLKVTATDTAGNTSAVSSALSITIDSSAPAAPPAPVLSAASDSGAADGITRVTTPVITGTAEAGSSVTLYDTDGVTVLGTTIATGGVWSITSSTLGDGSHTLTAKATDTAGNTSAASSLLSITIDSSAPAAPPAPVLSAASDSGAADGITRVTTPVITGTAESGSSVTLYDSDGVTVLGTTIATGGVWSIISSTLGDGSHTLTAKATDTAGNTSAASSLLSITIDSSAPAAPPAPVLSAASDSGAADGITRVTTPVITGTAEAGSSVTLYDTDGVTVLGTTIATGGVWSITSTTLGDGTHTLTAKATDTAGNSSAASSLLSITIDSSAPAAPPAPVLSAASDSGAADGITRVTTPVITGTAEAGSSVTLYDSDGVTVLGTTIATGGVWSITSTTLGDGAHTLKVTATDTAGNTSAVSSALTITIDSSAPAAPPAPVLSAASDSGAADGITRVTTPVITGTAESGSSVTLYDSDGVTVLGTTIATGGVWSITSSTLGDGAHTLKVTATDTAGNTSAASSLLSITIDSSAPAAPPAPVLSAASDSGAADGITRVTTPVITGTAEAGSSVTLYDSDGVTVLGTTIATGGVWSITSSTLGDGSHTLKVTVTDTAGNTSAVSSALTITIDSSAPAAPPAPVLSAASDSGASNSDGVTNISRPTITGRAEAGSSVTLYDTDGVTVLGTTIATGGVWSITSSTLGDGVHTLKVTATDTAGNSSAASSLLSITIDSSAPAAPPAPVLSAASDSGASNSDGVTNISRPTITGRAESGSSVTLYDTDGVTVLGTTIATGGVWSITSSTLGDGVHTLKVTATDAAGNSSAASSLLSITIDSSAPAAPPAPVLSAASDSGVSNSDGITNVSRPTITGRAESGSSVTLYDTDGVTVLGTTVATGGVWSITSSTLGDGNHSLTAKATDTAGNTSAASSLLSITIDSNAPAAPPAPVLSAASESGVSNSDGITNVSRPTITGRAESGSSVTLYDSDGVTVLGTTVATGGVWSITSSTLGDGSHSLSAKATDAAGNNSVASTTLTIVIDASVLSTPETPQLVGGGTSTTSTTPVFSGNAEANSNVTVRSDGLVIGTVQADASGKWSLSVPLALGVHQITATATDAAGNSGNPSPALTLNIVAPPIPVTTPPPLSAPPVLALAPDVTPIAAPPIRDAAQGQVSMSPLAAVIDAASGQADERFGSAPPPNTPYTPLPPIRTELVLNREISNLSINSQQGLNLSIPRDTFASADGSMPTLTARLADGSPLPSWIQFDPLTGTFTGKPPAGEAAALEIEIVAKDAKGNEVKTVFKLHSGKQEAAPPQASLSGKDLLLALGLSKRAGSDASMDGGTAFPDAVLDALPDATQEASQDAPYASALSGQLAREAQRFARDANTTLRHLAQL
ncbi:Ig-like domain-containing protein [Janthinobacterium sp. HLX7-2]|uniref:Ig-like domain-containing protein n=1 Tax=Janthinobacterium sp. HLX7-2 TaxID=1259331 RepID=UPI003F21B568